MEKKKYQTPQIKEVKLSPEDAVLTGCKTATGTAKTKTCKGPTTCVNNVLAS